MPGCPPGTLCLPVCHPLNSNPAGRCFPISNSSVAVPATPLPDCYAGAHRLTQEARGGSSDGIPQRRRREGAGHVLGVPEPVPHPGPRLPQRPPLRHSPRRPRDLTHRFRLLPPCPLLPVSPSSINTHPFSYLHLNPKPHVIIMRGFSSLVLVLFQGAAAQQARRPSGYLCPCCW